MQRGAIVVNPLKVRDAASLRVRLTAVFREHGWAEPLWLETTVEDPGTGQAQQALTAGADLVCPLGGDGTVRCVGTALRGSGVPLGLLPAGTGNLLARNLRLKVTRRYDDSLRRALTGLDRPIDVGVLRLDRDGSGAQVEEHSFLVMAGMGLEADMLGGTSEALKSRIGWPAYVLSGVRHLRELPVDMDVAMDGEHVRTGPTTTVLVGNCGMLTGGVRLMPAAEIDDGRLDAVVLAAGRAGEWARLVTQVLSRRSNDVQVRHLVGEQLAVRATQPRTVQVDGDILGQAVAMTVATDPRSLLVRVPRG